MRTTYPPASGPNPAGGPLATRRWPSQNGPMTSSNAALLVIDMQEAVVDGCLDVPAVIANINTLTARAREAGVPVVWIQNEDVTDPQMTAGAAGWQIAASLERAEGDAVVAKTYRDSFADTDLAAVLDKAHADRVVITGAHADFCVHTTAMAAVLRGYDVTLVTDAHTARGHTLPTGELSPETIVAFVNSRIGTMTYPGRLIEAVPTADVTF